MKISQPDSRSIKVVAETGVSFRVPYRFFWNGLERPAESIVLTTTGKGEKLVSEVRAFFLFGEIRDRFSADAAGITLERTWLVKTPGSVHLSFLVELEPRDDMSLFFPGVRVFPAVPAVPTSFLAERTSYPGALVVSLGKSCLLFFARSALCGADTAGIGVGLTDIEDEPSRVCVELRFPGVEEPAEKTGPRPADEEEQADTAIESPGSLERSHTLYVAFARSEDIHLVGAASVVRRLAPRSAAKTAHERAIDTTLLTTALHGALATHLYQKDGVAGMREVPGGAWLSSMAGLGCAIALRRLFPQDARLGELALRLADFSLKGQLPTGFFYEGFDTTSGEWRGIRGETQRTLLSVGQSSRIAELLLVLSRDLSEAGQPHEKYFLAGLRFVESFLDEKGRFSAPGSLHDPLAPAVAGDVADAIGGLELFFPLAEVLDRTGRDRYKKAMDQLVKRFSTIAWDPFLPPASRAGRGPDSAGALLATRLFIRMRKLGYKPVQPPVSGKAAAAARANESVRLFASLLVPWIRLHPEGESGVHAFPGCLVDSYVRQRLLFAGNETALALQGLGKLTTETETRTLLRSLARLCLSTSREAPLGTAYFQHTLWDEDGKAGTGRGKRGPVDARRLASEILAGLEIDTEFPKI